MRFSVMVPVLSVQITVAAPKVSTVVARFAMTPCRANRHAPNARKVVKATGISSGRMDMAKVRPESRLAEKEPVRKKATTHTSTKKTTPTMAMSRTNRLICC